MLSERYLPEISAPSFRINDHAREWLKHGHEVTVVTCAPNAPRGKVFPGYQNRLYQEEFIDGVRVIRIWTYIAANQGVLRRAMDYLSYMFMAVLLCWRYPKFDAIVATSGPFFTAVAGWMISILRWRPWIFEVRDLWPASVESVGAMTGWPIRICEKLELFLYRRCNRVVVLTKSFRQNLIDRGIDGEKIDVITNGIDADRFLPNQSVALPAIIESAAGSGKFLAVYVGTVGMAHGLETVLDVADECQGREIHFLIVGEGAQRKPLEEYARRLGVKNVSFADNIQRESVANLLTLADASIVHLKPDPLFKTVIPSKIFESMATGTPIVMAVEGESAEIIESARCGLCVQPGNVTQIRDALIRLIDDKDFAAELGGNGRSAVKSEYSRREKAQCYLASLSRALGRLSLAVGEDSSAAKAQEICEHKNAA